MLSTVVSVPKYAFRFSFLLNVPGVHLNDSSYTVPAFSVKAGDISQSLAAFGECFRICAHFDFIGLPVLVR